MLKRYTYSIIVAVTVLASACSKETGMQDCIAFDVSVPSVKTLLDQNNITGERIVIYDVHNKNGGVNATASPELELYLNGHEVVYDNAWKFVDKTNSSAYVEIPWTRNGTHNFFAYNAAPDGVVVSHSGIGATEYDQTLNISDLDFRTHQYDMIYACTTRDVRAQGTGLVTLDFKHAFSSIVFLVRNISSEDKTVTSFNVNGIVHKADIVVDFASRSQSVSDAAVNSSVFTFSGSNIIAKGKEMDIFGSKLIWPQNLAEDADITMTYDGGTVGMKFIERFGIKVWEPGKRYIYRISIADDKVILDAVDVVDWITNDVILED